MKFSDIHIRDPIVLNDGGHGMIFRMADVEIMFIQHMPNNTPCERPSLF